MKSLGRMAMRVAHNPQGPPTGGRSMSPTIKRAAPSASPMQIPVSDCRRPLRQLGDVGGDAAGLVARQQIGGRAPAGVLLEVDIGERVAFAVLDDEGGGVRLLNVPRRRKAARRHAVILTVRCRQTEKGWPRRGGYHAACCATGAKYSGGLRTYRRCTARRR